MPKKSKSPAEVSWHIMRFRKSPAEFVGHARAKDADAAVEKYIEEHAVTDALEKKRLYALRAS